MIDWVMPIKFSFDRCLESLEFKPIANGIQKKVTTIWGNSKMSAEYVTTATTHPTS